MHDLWGYHFSQSSCRTFVSSVVGEEGAAAGHGMRPTSAASQSGAGPRIRTHYAQSLLLCMLPRLPGGRRGFSVGTTMATGHHSSSLPPSKRRMSGTVHTSSGTTMSCLTRKSRGSRRSRNPKYVCLQFLPGHLIPVIVGWFVCLLLWPLPVFSVSLLSGS